MPCVPLVPMLRVGMPSPTLCVVLAGNTIRTRSVPDSIPTETVGTRANRSRDCGYDSLNGIGVRPLSLRSAFIGVIRGQFSPIASLPRPPNRDSRNIGAAGIDGAEWKASTYVFSVWASVFRRVRCADRVPSVPKHRLRAAGDDPSSGGRSSC